MADEEAAVDEAGASGPGQPATAHLTPRAAVGAPTGDINSYIGSRLRQAFDDVAKQPIPDRFLQLMRDLDKV